MRVWMGLAVAAALLAGCEQVTYEGDPPAEATASLPPGRPAIYEAANSETAEPFVRALYAAHAAGAVEATAPGRDPLLGRTLNAAIGADAQKGARALLKTDPVCGCTPGQTVALKSLTVTQTDRVNATAQVTLTVDGQDRSQSLTLLREGVSWRVADVVPAGEGSVLDRLVASLG